MNKPESKISQPTNRSGRIVRLVSKRKRPATNAEQWQAAGLDLAQTVQELEQLVTVDATRVVKLHQRISAGEYVIDGERVAGKLLDFESSLPD